jgi:hypothetical protein
MPKAKAKQNASTHHAPNDALTSLIEQKLKGKVLFSENIESIKSFLSKVKISAL